MPVTLQVSDVRRELIARMGAPSGPPQGKASNAFLGQKFHELFAALVDPDSQLNFARFLAQRGPDIELQKSAAIDFVFANFIGPLLRNNTAQLQTAAEEVHQFWRAVHNLIQWLSELYGALEGDDAHPPCQLLFSPEQPFECSLQETEWTQPIRLVGVTDAILYLPQAQLWAILELKLGAQSHPEADLAQAALYHLLASHALSETESESGDHPAEMPLALLRFQPDLEEQLFQGSGLAEAQQKLLALMAEMAGVRPDRLAKPQPTADAAAHITSDRPAGRGFWAWLRARWFPLTITHVTEAQPPSPETPTQPDSAGTPPEAPPADQHPSTAPPTESTPQLQAPDLSCAQTQSEQYTALGQRLIDTLHEYNVHAELDGPPIIGPTFLRFAIRPGSGVKIKNVIQRSQEIQMRLGLDAWPLIHMVQGRLVIDLQREDRQYIDFASIEPQIPPADPLLGSAMVPLGLDLDGNLHCFDLADPDCAHLLVAGTTGSGKSEWLKCAVAGLISRNTPHQLQLLIIDPKRNAFLWMQHTPYLCQPLVFPDETPVAEALAGLADEMDRRFAMLDGAASLAEWSRSTGRVLPRIICVCDEYADLVYRGKAEREATESQIVRLGAKARAAGIHLMIATQQPSRKVVSGALDTNIPARIGLKMQRAIESRMVLGESGAELLLGRGDLLFKNINPPQRFQGAYLPDDQRNQLLAEHVTSLD